jgi:hypothetical protein
LCASDEGNKSKAAELLGIQKTPLPENQRAQGRIAVIVTGRVMVDKRYYQADVRTASPSVEILCPMER